MEMKISFISAYTTATRCYRLNPVASRRFSGRKVVLPNYSSFLGEITARIESVIRHKNLLI